MEQPDYIGKFLLFLFLLALQFLSYFLLTGLVVSMFSMLLVIVLFLTGSTVGIFYYMSSIFHVLNPTGSINAGEVMKVFSLIALVVMLIAEAVRWILRTFFDVEIPRLFTWRVAWIAITCVYGVAAVLSSNSWVPLLFSYAFTLGAAGIYLYVRWVRGNIARRIAQI